MAERDAKGRFTKEYTGGPGRPPKKREERFLEITLSACTLADWEAIVKKAVALAKRGDATSRKWLSDYLIGPPQQRVDVTTKDESLNAGRLTDTERLALLAALIDGAEDGPTGQDTQE
jgi:hypothetical protein